MRAFLGDYFDFASWSESSPESSIRGTPQQCAEQIAAQHAAGVQHLVFVPCGYEQEQVQAIARDVLPLLATTPAG